MADDFTVSGAPMRALQADVSETLKLVRAMSIATSHNTDRIIVVERVSTRNTNDIAVHASAIAEIKADRAARHAQGLTLRAIRPGSWARLALAVFLLMMGAAGAALAAQAALHAQSSSGT